MPQQLYCAACTCRTFYLMAQDDGSIEAFCVTSNHKRVLVNIPKLVEHILKVQDGNEDTNGTADLGLSEGDESPKIQAQAAANDTANKHGTSGGTDLSGG